MSLPHVIPPAPPLSLHGLWCWTAITLSSILLRNFHVSVSDPCRLPSIALPFLCGYTHLDQTQTLVQPWISSTSFPIFTFKRWSQVSVTEKIKGTRREPPADSVKIPAHPPLLPTTSALGQSLHSSHLSPAWGHCSGNFPFSLLSIYGTIPVREKKLGIFILLNSLAAALYIRWFFSRSSILLSKKIRLSPASCIHTRILMKGVARTGACITSSQKKNKFCNEVTKEKDFELLGAAACGKIIYVGS